MSEKEIEIDANSDNMIFVKFIDKGGHMYAINLAEAGVFKMLSGVIPDLLKNQ